MKRRSFFAVLAALPFVGKLVAAARPYPSFPVDPYCVGHPDERMPTGVRWHRLGCCPQVVRDPYCPIGHGYVLARREQPTVLIRSVGDDRIHTLHYLTQDDLYEVGRKWGFLPPVPTA